MILYNGSERIRKVWDLTTIGGGADENGPGLYFTNDKKDAARYGEYVHKCEVDIKRCIRPGAHPRKSPLRKILQKCPVLREKLDDWGEDPAVAFEEALNAMYNRTDYYDCLQQVWYDFFRDNEELWAGLVVSIAGFDCYLVDPSKRGGVQHVVVFNPATIRTLSISHR